MVPVLWSQASAAFDVTVKPRTRSSFTYVSKEKKNIETWEIWNVTLFKRNTKGHKKETMEGRDRWGVIPTAQTKVCPLSHGLFIFSLSNFPSKNQKDNINQTKVPSYTPNMVEEWRKKKKRKSKYRTNPLPILSSHLAAPGYFLIGQSMMKRLFIVSPGGWEGYGRHGGQHIRNQRHIHTHTLLSTITNGTNENVLSKHETGDTRIHRAK